jgi:DNA-binding PadR family transcriptional regulator
LRTDDLIRTVLKLSRGNEFYGYDVHRKLSETVHIEISRFYRVLARMLDEGYLESHWEKSSFGPKKRVYRLGEKGKEELDRILLDSIQTIHDFYGDYLLNLPPEADVFERICGMLTVGLKAQTNIACMVASEYTAMHERMIRSLRDKLSEGKMYFVKPRSAVVETKLDSLILLEGISDDIPFKDNYLDLLVVTDIPRRKALESALGEWHRALKKDAKLGILTPTVTLRKYEDPLTIGDFIEKYEHGSIEKGEHLDSELLKRLLGKFFQDVQEKQIVHMTLFMASKLWSSGS